MSDLGCHFGAPKSSKSELKFDQNSSTDLERHHSGASGGRFRLDFGTIWGAISGSRARDAKLAKIAPRHSESMIFRVPRGPKKDQKWLRNQLPAATWLQERLGGLWGSIWVHFGVHFEVPNRSKNDTENKLIFKRFWPPPGNLRAGLRRGNMAPFGPGGGLIGGGNQSHRIDVSTYQRFKDSWYQYSYNKDTWRQ